MDHSRALISGFRRDPAVRAVIVSYTPDFDLARITQCVQYLLDPSVLFLATETDPTARARLAEEEEAEAIMPCKWR